MECPNCRNKALHPKFKWCPLCGSKLPHASASQVPSSGKKDGRESFTQVASTEQQADPGGKSDLGVDKGRFEGDNSQQGETTTVSKPDVFSAAQCDVHSSAAAINSDQSKNPPGDKGLGAVDVQGPAERVQEHSTSEGAKNASSVLKESYSGGAKPAAQKLGHVESLQGKSTGTTASQVSPIQTLRAAVDCDQNISSGSSFVAGKEVASLGDSSETSRWHMASGHTQLEPLGTSEIQQQQQQTAAHQQQVRPMERHHDPSPTQQQQQRRQLPQRPQQLNQHQQMLSADRQHHNQHQQMPYTDRQHCNQHEQMPSADQQHYNQQQQMPSADEQHYNQHQLMPSADQQHYNQHQQMQSADWQHYNQHQKMPSADKQQYNQHEQMPPADRQYYNQHQQMPPEDRQHYNQHQQMPPADRQYYNQHQEIPPTGHQHYNQHQHLQQNQQKQPLPGGQVLDHQQQPSSLTKQQNQQVDPKQCLNAEAIQGAKRAEGAHLQPGNKVPGSTDPNGSSQVSQNRKGRDDLTSQTNDQNTKILEGGIKGKDGNIVNEGESRRTAENRDKTSKEKVESTSPVLSAVPEELTRRDTVPNDPLREQMNKDNGSEASNTKEDGHWYLKPAMTSQDAEASQGKTKPSKKQGKDKGGGPSLPTAEIQHTLKPVEPGNGVTVVFHVLLESNFKMTEESLHIRAGARDLGQFSLNCVDLKPVWNGKDKKKMMRFSGQLTLSVDCARQGTSYKYVVVKKEDLHYEYLAEFPPKRQGTVVNRFLSIPDKYLNPGGKLQLRIG